ncbi:MAG: polysaccharide biosynthesis tyrosine autokinase [Anaerolineae bacterium]
MELTRYVKVVVRWWWVVALVAGIAGGVVALTGINHKPVYTANAILSVVPVGTQAIDYGTYVYFERLVNTYSTIARSTTVTAKAKTILGVSELPKYRIETIPQTELMQFSVDANDPEFAQKACNVLAQLLIEANQQRFTGSGGILGDLTARMSSLRTDLEALTKEKTAAETAIPRDDDKIANLQRDIDAKQQEYNAVLSSYNQVQNSILTLSNALQLTIAAEVPQESSDRNPIINIAIAAIAGAMAGVALAFVLENTNTKLFSTKQIENVTNSSVIAKIPVLSSREKGDVFRSNQVAAEAFRRLRIQLFPSLHDTGHKAFLVTSSVPQEGKSTTAANLARAIAQVVEQCVVLVDCDLRRPQVHKIFDISNDEGLTDILAGEVSIEEAVRDTNHSRLKVITAGTAITNPTEVISSQRMLDLIDELLTEYTTVVLDCPPILAATDAIALAPHTSGMVMVLDINKSDEKSLRLASSQLKDEGINVLGVVLNRTKLDKSFQYYRYYSKRNR